jgi:hypothetical protein
MKIAHGYSFAVALNLRHGTEKAISLTRQPDDRWGLWRSGRIFQHRSGHHADHILYLVAARRPAGASAIYRLVDHSAGKTAR